MDAGGSEAGAVKEIDEGGTNSDGKRKGVEETLVAVNKAGLDRLDGNVGPRVELEAVDTIIYCISILPQELQQ